MPERAEHPADKLLHSLMETFADTVPKQKSVRFFDEGNSVSEEISTKMNRLFGRQKSVHKILGGGQSADVLLWRNKKISLSVLAIATAIWVLFEWLNYHFLSLVCFALAIGMVIQFLWSNASGFANRSPSEVPRLVLPDELFANVAISIGAQINQFLGFIQDVACGRNLKQFAMVYYYHLFDAASDSAKLYNDLRWNVSRPQGFEAVMRVRCSQGLQVQEYSGNFCRHISTDIDLSAVSLFIRSHILFSLRDDAHPLLAGAVLLCSVSPSDTISDEIANGQDEDADEEDDDVEENPAANDKDGSEDDEEEEDEEDVLKPPTKKRKWGG